MLVICGHPIESNQKTLYFHLFIFLIFDIHELPTVWLASLWALGIE